MANTKVQILSQGQLMFKQKISNIGNENIFDFTPDDIHGLLRWVDPAFGLDANGNIASTPDDIKFYLNKAKAKDN